MQVKQIIEGYTNLITGDYDKEEQQRKLDLCKQCKVFNSVLGTCGYFKKLSGCGCVVKAKATTNIKCPYDVWALGHTNLTLKIC